MRSYLVLAFLVGLGFPAATPGAPSPAQAPAATGQQEVTLTGCLSRAADGNYILTNARLSEAPGAAAKGIKTVGTAGKATEPAGSGTGANGMTWSLLGGNDTDQHVGHQIQVTGLVATEDLVAEHGRGDEPTAVTGSTRGDAGSPNRPRLNVRVLTLIASSCSQ